MSVPLTWLLNRTHILAIVKSKACGLQGLNRDPKTTCTPTCPASWGIRGLSGIMLTIDVWVQRNSLRAVLPLTLYRALQHSLRKQPGGPRCNQADMGCPDQRSITKPSINAVNEYKYQCLCKDTMQRNCKSHPWRRNFALFCKQASTSWNVPSVARWEVYDAWTLMPYYKHKWQTTPIVSDKNCG